MPGWIGGEAISEFKVKLAHLCYRRELPPALMGLALADYLFSSFKGYYAQNHSRDYESTYFMFDVLNNSHLNRLLQNLKKEGVLRLNQ